MPKEVRSQSNPSAGTRAFVPHPPSLLPGLGQIVASYGLEVPEGVGAESPVSRAIHRGLSLPPVSGSVPTQSQQAQQTERSERERRRYQDGFYNVIANPILVAHYQARPEWYREIASQIRRQWEQRVGHALTDAEFEQVFNRALNARLVIPEPQRATMYVPGRWVYIDDYWFVIPEDGATPGAGRDLDPVIWLKRREWQSPDIDQKLGSIRQEWQRRRSQSAQQSTNAPKQQPKQTTSAPSKSHTKEKKR